MEKGERIQKNIYSTHRDELKREGKSIFIFTTIHSSSFCFFFEFKSINRLEFQFNPTSNIIAF